LSAWCLFYFYFFSFGNNDQQTVQILICQALYYILMILLYCNFETCV